MLKRWLPLIGIAFTIVPYTAKGQGLAEPCPALPDEEAREICTAVAQAIESAQPQVGILIAGGNPVIGTASTGGLRFGTIPRVDLTGRLNLVFIRLPDILAAEAGGTVQRLNQRFGVPAPALAGNIAVGVLPGWGLAPGIGGIGSVDLLASASWLPFRTFGVEGFDVESPDLAWGAGARIGLLRESFTAPGVSISLMHRRLGEVAFGDVCPGAQVADVCPGSGDAGEFVFDLRNWSTRAVIGKRLLGVGLAGGVGRDSYRSDASYAFRYPDPVLPAGERVVRRDDVDLRSTRWSVFGNLSYTFLLTSLAFEAGWQQGQSPVPGFGQNARFDPRSGSFFGSAGARLSF